MYMPIESFQLNILLCQPVLQANTTAHRNTTRQCMPLQGNTRKNRQKQANTVKYNSVYQNRSIKAKQALTSKYNITIMNDNYCTQRERAFKYVFFTSV